MRFFHPHRFFKHVLGDKVCDKLYHSFLVWSTSRNYSSRIKYLRNKVRESKLRVVFYTNEPQKWSYESLYRELESSLCFEPIIVVVPRYLVHLGRDLTRMTLEEQYAFYEDRGYKVEYGYKDGKYIDIASFKPDIFFYLQLAEIPGIDAPSIVSKYSLTCYCPYAFQLSDYKKEYLPFFHKLLFRYYVVHELTRDRFESYEKGNARNCVVVGYPKLDVYNKRDFVDAEKYWRDPQKIKVIYAPHHSVNDTFRFSTFSYNHDFILHLARRTDTTWVFKPHPMLRRAVISAGLMTREEIDKYYQSWAEIGRVYDQGDYFDIFKSSDVMITDCGSFLAEYLPSGKPLIRLINDESCPLDRLGRFISGGFYNVHTNDELLEVFNEVIMKNNDFLETRRKKIAETLTDHKETAAHKVLLDLYSVLNIKDGA